MNAGCHPALGYMTWRRSATHVSREQRKLLALTSTYSCQVWKEPMGSPGLGFFCFFPLKSRFKMVSEAQS